MTQERLTALEDVAALATIGATYPELMLYLQAEMAKCEQTALAQPEQFDCPRCGHVCSQRTEPNQPAAKVNDEGFIVETGLLLSPGVLLYTTPPAAQPEQEPVAWRDPTNIDPGQGCTYTKERREKWPHIYRQALYTAPPAAQRTWVGLTDDDRFEIAAEQHGWEDLLIAAEAKLKEKNNG